MSTEIPGFPPRSLNEFPDEEVTAYRQQYPYWQTRSDQDVRLQMVIEEFQANNSLGGKKLQETIQTIIEAHPDKVAGVIPGTLLWSLSEE